MNLQDAPFVSTASIAPTAVQLGRLHGFDRLGQPLVAELATLPDQVLVARSTVRLARAMVGRQVVVCFEGGDPQRVIVLGVIAPQPLDRLEPAALVHAQIDGERRVIEADREIVLRCGEASITLTRAGKVLIQGSYVVSRSTGYNRIKGAAVDIN